jgi:hypothetical protein
MMRNHRSLAPALRACGETPHVTTASFSASMLESYHRMACASNTRFAIDVLRSAKRNAGSARPNDALIRV